MWTLRCQLGQPLDEHRNPPARSARGGDYRLGRGAALQIAPRSYRIARRDEVSYLCHLLDSSHLTGLPKIASAQL